MSTANVVHAINTRTWRIACGYPGQTSDHGNVQRTTDYKRVTCRRCLRTTVYFMALTDMDTTSAQRYIGKMSITQAVQQWKTDHGLTPQLMIPFPTMRTR